METRARLTARISSLSEFRELIRAMRAIAASHVQEAQSALPSIRDYSGQIERAIAAAATLLSPSGAQIEAPVTDGEIIIALCSEQGLSGAYSSDILDHARSLAVGGKALGLAGRKGALLAEERDIPVLWNLPMTSHARGVATLCLDMMQKIAGFSRITVVFAEYVSGGRYEIRSRQVAPPEPRLLESRETNEKPFHYLPPGELLMKLTSEYVFAELMRAVMEAFASENAARLKIMEAADQSAEDKLKRLSQQERVTRQQEVTAELLDIVVGAEAVRLHE